MMLSKENSPLRTGVGDGGWDGCENVALTLEVVWGCAALKTPFSGYFLATETHFFQPFSSSSSETPTSTLLKKSYQFCRFWLLRRKFWQKFVPETPVSSPKISSSALGYVHLQSIVDTSIKHTISLQSTPMLTSCIYIRLI